MAMLRSSLRCLTDRRSRPSAKRTEAMALRWGRGITGFTTEWISSLSIMRRTMNSPRRNCIGCGVLDRDLAPKSEVRAIVAGMHEALPHSTGSEHAMDDWDLGVRTGELVYNWLYDAQASGKHVYIIASHSHFYSQNVFNTSYWKEHTNRVVPGWIVGTAGAHRYLLSTQADPASKTNIYGYLRATVHADGVIDFA